jgi:carboxylesterase
MAETVWPEAEAYSFEGGKTGVLVLHGFTGCNQSMRPLGEGLAKAGFTVEGPRLPGHGTSVSDMATRTWQEWTGEAEKGLAKLAEKCDKVFVVGLSMGGTITLYLAEQHPEKIAGIITINAPVAKLNPLMPVTLMNQYILKNMTIPGVGSDIKNPDMKEMAYDKVPTRAAAQLYKLMKLTKNNLASIKMPVLAIGSREDHVVPTMNGPYILDHIASKDKELIWLANSYHVATLDNDKDEIINRCTEFIKRLSAGKS